MTVASDKTPQEKIDEILRSFPTTYAFQNPTENLGILSMINADKELPAWYSNLGLASGNAYQESPIEFPSFADTVLKPTIEEQYNNIQEQLSELTKTHNEERKANLEIQREKDRQIRKYQQEIEQLQKKLARAKRKAKSYKDESKLKDVYVQARADIDDLQVRMTTAEVELNIKKEGK